MVALDNDASCVEVKLVLFVWFICVKLSLLCRGMIFIFVNREQICVFADHIPQITSQQDSSDFEISRLYTTLGCAIKSLGSTKMPSRDSSSCKALSGTTARW